MYIRKSILDYILKLLVVRLIKQRKFIYEGYEVLTEVVIKPTNVSEEMLIPNGLYGVISQKTELFEVHIGWTLQNQGKCTSF